MSDENLDSSADLRRISSKKSGYSGKANISKSP